MLEIIRDSDGNILASLEWNLVNDKGEFDQHGKYVWVNECEINPYARNNGILKKFVKIITDKVPWAEFGYFERRKYNDRLRIYTRRRWLKLLKKENKNGWNKN